MDANKTSLTHDVTAASALWLEAHGFKPVETEVGMPTCADTTKGWIADLAAVIQPTQTELIDLKLLPRKPGWNELRDPARMAAWKAKQAAWQALYAEMMRTMTCLVEVKTSRADFRGDRKWMALCPSDLAYVAVPKGMVKLEECPSHWGVLEFHDGAVRCVQVPIPNHTTLEQRFSIVMAIAIRRDHHTRHARWREYAKRDRMEQRETKAIDSIAKVARIMERVVRGECGSVETCFEFSGMMNVPDYVLERLRPIYGIAQPIEPLKSFESILSKAV